MRGYKRVCGSWRRLGVGIYVVVLAGAVAASAAASHTGTVFDYYSGTLTSNEGRSTGHYYCGTLWHSRHMFSTGTGGYGTAAIIIPDGSWIASNRSQSGDVTAEVSPNSTTANKAHCLNSTPWQVTYSSVCRAAVGDPHGLCV